NTDIFSKPGWLQENYFHVATALQERHSRFQLPRMLPTVTNKFWLDLGEMGAWRLFEYVENSTTILNVQRPEQAYCVAGAFGKLSKDLSGLSPAKLKEVLPGFHDVSFRFTQLKEAIQQGSGSRLKAAQTVLTGLDQFEYLHQFYCSFKALPNLFKKYVLHHDAKISNILFDQSGQQVITPIDMDTTMAGYFFSDMGDMVRSLVPNLDENDTRLNDLEIQKLNYIAIFEGYHDEVKDYFSSTEIAQLHKSGMLLLYMQCMRFIADYLNGDVYYQVKHPEHNLQRAQNQLRALQLLEQFLQYQFKIRFQS
ncbi:MAG: hypothetical protein RLY16_2575, partial [Bacteroidota bacterium]